MKEQTLRIEIKVDGVLIEVREFKTNHRNNVTSYWDFLKTFKKDIGSWNFMKFFNAEITGRAGAAGEGPR